MGVKNRGEGLALPSWQDQPQVGQSVWDMVRGNGVITRVDYAGKNVYVNHYENGQGVYELSEFFGMFDERLNQWVLIPL